eukprot:CFRG4917T1
MPRRKIAKDTPQDEQTHQQHAGSLAKRRKSSHTLVERKRRAGIGNGMKKISQLLLRSALITESESKRQHIIISRAANYIVALRLQNNALVRGITEFYGDETLRLMIQLATENEDLERQMKQREKRAA